MHFSQPTQSMMRLMLWNLCMNSCLSAIASCPCYTDKNNTAEYIFRWAMLPVRIEYDVNICGTFTFCYNTSSRATNDYAWAVLSYVLDPEQRLDALALARYNAHKERRHTLFVKITELNKCSFEATITLPHQLRFHIALGLGGQHGKKKRRRRRRCG